MAMRAAMERKNPVNLRVSDDVLLDVGETFEGFVPFTYDDKDPKSLANKTFITEANARMVDGRLTGPYGGTLTKGYGHTRTTKPGDRITREEALSLLRTDAREAESCVHRYVTVPLTQGEFNGIWDLFFNVGPGTLPNAQWPNGKDGIACLGKSGGGRPSTLLTKLNEGDYAAAAECFTQWRNKGTLWEWGLLKRRVRLMLVFMGLPIMRAMNALPPALPPTDTARYAMVQRCVALAKDELDDNDFMRPAPKPAPVIEEKPAATPEPSVTAAAPLEATIDGERVTGPPPAQTIPPEVYNQTVSDVAKDAAADTLVLDKPASPPSAAAPDTAGAAEAPKDPSPAASPSAPPAATPAPTPPPAANPEAETKHPAKSTTIWGVLVVAMAPQLEQIGNQLMSNSVVGGTIGKILMTLGVILVVMGRVSATKALSTSAPIRTPK